MLPTSVWLTAARMLKQKDVLKTLQLERFESPELHSQPLLDAVIAEGLRMHSRPNMYRLAAKDCTTQSPESACPIAVKKDEWVWLFIHWNKKVSPEP
jgi:hypothetical protein